VPASNAQHRLAFYGFRSGHGGIPRVLANLMNGLIDQNIQVDLLSTGDKTMDFQYLRPQIRVIHLDTRGALRGVFTLANYLEKECPDALLANREWANRNSILARGMTGVKTRIWFRIGTNNSMSLRRRHFLNRFTRKATMRYCYKRADGLISVSKGVANDIASTFPVAEKKIHVLHNPSVSSDITIKANEAPDHPWLQDDNPPVILGVGRLTRAKGFSTLLRSFAKIRSARDCRLIILGEGKEHNRLIALAGELGVQRDVSLPGYVRNPFAYMNKSALFVLSSAWEGSPNTLIEALAVGVPVVSTDCESGPGEILQEGRYGPLVPVGDVDALARAMALTLDNPPTRALLQMAAAPYRADRCVQAYLQVLIKASGSGK
jgi:glycosyltransferase involved in cell wall biosynthesis